MQQLPWDEQSFESANGLPDLHGHFGLVAERRSRKAKVAGSIPAGGKFFTPELVFCFAVQSPSSSHYVAVQRSLVLLLYRGYRFEVVYSRLGRGYGR